MITSNRASLVLHSETRPASEVSAVLGLEPTRSFEKGDAMPRGRVRRTSGWILDAPESEDPADDANSYSRLESLARVLHGTGPALELLREHWDTSISYGGFSDSGQGGFFFPAETMAQLGALGCSWTGTVYLEEPDDDGVLEQAVLPVLPGREEEFEAAFATARPLIAETPGFRSLRLSRGIETPNEYLLLVEWDTLEAHETGFRGTQRYEEWRALLHHFYEPFPAVVHFAPVTSA